jgi:hypothetical protein
MKKKAPKTGRIMPLFIRQYYGLKPSGKLNLTTEEIAKMNADYMAREPETEGERLGKEVEETFLRVWSRPENQPSWFISIKKASAEIDLFKGIDFIIKTDSKQIRIQVKAKQLAQKEVEEFFQRRIVLVTIPPHANDDAVRALTLNRIHEFWAFKPKNPKRKNRENSQKPRRNYRRRGK